MPYINFKHGDKLQSIEFKAGDNVNIVPKADGTGFTISVKPDPGWKTPGTATVGVPGLLALNGNANQVLKGDGTWGSMSSSDGNNVPSAPADANTTSHLYTPNGWKKYTIEQVSFLMVDNAQLLDSGNPSSLTIQAQGNKPSTKKLNGRDYYYNTFKASVGGIYVLKEWFESLGCYELVVSVTRRGGNGLWALSLVYNDGQNITSKLVYECPNPVIHARGDSKIKWHHYGMTSGWGATTSSDPIGSYMSQVFNPMDDCKYLTWGTASAEAGEGAVAVEHTLVFSKPMIKFLD